MLRLNLRFLTCPAFPAFLTSAAADTPKARRSVFGLDAPPYDKQAYLTLPGIPYSMAFLNMLPSAMASILRQCVIGPPPLLASLVPIPFSLPVNPMPTIFHCCLCAFRFPPQPMSVPASSTVTYNTRRLQPGCFTSYIVHLTTYISLRIV